jgi:uncharacterized protein
MPLTISDSSVLIHLSKIKRLQLLRDFYGNVAIPPAVWKEVIDEGKGRYGALELNKAYNKGWLQINYPQNNSILRLLKRELDQGEAEAITLAIENISSILLIDETDGRKIARLYNLKIAGVIGILIRAKAENKITTLRDEMDKLVKDGGFWMSKELYQKALNAVGE